jgi:hypothetical protein
VYSFAAADDRSGMAYRVKRINYSEPPYVQLEAVNYAENDYTADFLAVPDSADIIGAIGYNDPVILEPGSTTWVFTNLPPIHDAEAYMPGAYFIATGASGNWLSATVYRSTDSGASYFSVGTINGPATLGTCNTMLPDGTTLTWDTVNTLTVTLLRGYLFNATDEQLFAGANTCLVGSEIIQFGVANSIGVNQWTVSRLLRGRRATEPYTATHAGSEQFAVLNDITTNLGVGVSFIAFAQVDVGVASLYKVVPTGHVLSDESSSSNTLTGQNMIPFDPVQLSTVVDSSSGYPDVMFTWVRRDRRGTELTSGLEIPMSEVPETYHLQFVNSGSTVVRSVLSTVSSFIYDHTMRATDFGSASAHLDGATFKVAQVSPTMGDGRFAVLALTTANSG